MFLLNVAIPTFKRPEMLKNLLESIVANCPIEIGISIYDDSDVNYTENQIVVNKYISRLNIFYQKNKENLGIDKNIAQCFQKSNSKYTMVIGEDDLFLPGGLVSITTILKEKSPEFLFLKYTYFNGLKDINWTTKIAENYETMNFLCNYIDKLGFIGSFVVETEKFNMQLFIDGETYFNHVGCLLVGLDKIDIICITKDNVIRNRVGQLDAFTWKNEALNVFTGFDKVLALTEHVKLKSINVRQLRIISKSKFDPFILRRLIKLKAEKVLNNREIYSLGSNKGVGIYRYLAIFIPRSICSIIYFIHIKKIWS